MTGAWAKNVHCGHINGGTEVARNYIVKAGTVSQIKTPFIGGWINLGG